MGVTFIKTEKIDPIDMDAVTKQVYKNIKAEHDAKIDQEIGNEKLFKELHRDRLNWEKVSKGKDVRKVAAIPRNIHQRAVEMFGENYLRDDKLFKKFLDTEIMPGVKGEICLTVPRNKL